MRGMSIFTPPKTHADATEAKEKLIAEGYNATKIFPVIDTSKCTVDAKTLEVWQVEVEIGEFVSLEKLQADHEVVEAV